MAGRVRELIIAHVRKLITNLVGLQENEENFHLYEQYVLSSLQHHRFLSVDSHAVRRSIEGIITKFEVHGHLDAAKKLAELLKTYLCSDVFKDHPECDIQWSLISLLLHLSVKPTANVRSLKTIKDVPEKTEEKEDFDWVSYLREGDENFGLGVYDSTDSDDEWDSETEEKTDYESECLLDSGITSEKQLLSDGICDKEIIKVKQKEDFIRALQEIQASENWMETHLQHYNWIPLENKETICYSKHPSANFAKRCFEYLDAQGNDTSDFLILSEYQVIRQILWMFHAPSSSHLFTEIEDKIVPKRNIAVSSLSPEALHEYLSYYCPYFNMLKEWRKFGNEIIPPAKCEGYTLPSHTYEAYWSAIQELLNDFRSFLISVEEKVIKQDRTYTFICLHSDLKDKLTELETINRVHKKGVCNWKEVPNRESASRLLSVLYGELIESHTNSLVTSIILHLFLKTFRVFVDIMDTWMTDGFLEDWRDEFVIARNYNHTLERNSELWLQGYTIHTRENALVSTGIAPMQFMEAAMTSVLYAGKSMDLLLELGRLPDLRKKTRTEGSLYEKLLSSIEKDLSRYSCTEINNSDIQGINYTPQNVKEVEQNNNLISEIKGHLLYFADPLLIKGFENYLNLTDSDLVNKALNGMEEYTKESKERGILFRRLKDYLKCPILPLKSVLENNLRRLVQEKQMISCSMVTNIFQHEFKLSTHIKVIRSVFLMEAGDIMHQFCAILFEQMETGQADSFSLSCSLENCIDVRFPEYGSRFSFIINSNACSSVLEQMNTIQLKYKVDWPLSLVLSNYSMELYNSLFRFLLKIKWALWNLQQLRFSDLEKKNTVKNCAREQENSIVHRLQFLRFWLLHSISSIHSYLMGQVINLLGPQLEQNIEKAADLDTIIEVHNVYVRTIHGRCLQPGGNDIIKTAILQMVMTAISVAQIWQKNPMMVSEARIKEVGQLYFECHCFLGIVLSNMVESGTTLQTEKRPVTVFSSHSVLPKELNNSMQYIFGEISWQRSQPCSFTKYISFLSSYRDHYFRKPESSPQLCTKNSSLFLVLDAYFDYLTCLNKKSGRSYGTIRTTSSCSDMLTEKGGYNFPVRRCRSQLKLTVNAGTGNKKDDTITDVEKLTKAEVSKLCKPYSCNKRTFISEPNSFELNITSDLNQRSKHIKRLTYKTNYSMLFSNEPEQVRTLLKNGIYFSDHDFPVNAMIPKETLFEYTLNKKAHSHTACSFTAQNRNVDSSARNSEALFSDFHSKSKLLHIASAPKFEKYLTRKKKTKTTEHLPISCNESQLVGSENTNMNEKSIKRKKMFQSIAEAIKHELKKKNKTTALGEIAAEGLNDFHGIKSNSDFCSADNDSASQQYFKKYFHFRKEINNFEKINCDTENGLELGINHSDSKEEAYSCFIKYLFLSFLYKFRKFLH